MLTWTGLRRALVRRAILMGAGADAEDVAHDILVKVLRLRPPIRSGSYFVASVRNALSTRRRREQRRPILPLEEWRQGVDYGDLSAALAIREAWVALRPKERQALGATIYGLTQHEAAALSGVTSVAIRLNRKRARDRLRRVMALS